MPPTPVRPNERTLAALSRTAPVKASKTDTESIVRARRAARANDIPLGAPVFLSVHEHMLANLPKPQSTAIEADDFPSLPTASTTEAATTSDFELEFGVVARPASQTTNSQAESIFNLIGAPRQDPQEVATQAFALHRPQLEAALATLDAYLHATRRPDRNPSELDSMLTLHAYEHLIGPTLDAIAKVIRARLP